MRLNLVESLTDGSSDAAEVRKCCDTHLGVHIKSHRSSCPRLKQQQQHQQRNSTTAQQHNSSNCSNSNSATATTISNQQATNNNKQPASQPAQTTAHNPSVSPVSPLPPSSLFLSPFLPTRMSRFHVVYTPVSITARTVTLAVDMPVHVDGVSGAARRRSTPALMVERWASKQRCVSAWHHICDAGSSQHQVLRGQKETTEEEGEVQVSYDASQGQIAPLPLAVTMLLALVLFFSWQWHVQSFLESRWEGRWSAPLVTFAHSRAGLHPETSAQDLELAALSRRLRQSILEARL